MDNVNAKSDKVETEKQPAEKQAPRDFRGFPKPTNRRATGSGPRFDLVEGVRAITVANDDALLGLYRSQGWIDAYHSLKSEQPGSGYVNNENEFQVDAQGRLMHRGDYVMLILDEMHAHLERGNRDAALAPLQGISAAQHGKDGDDSFLSVDVVVKESEQAQPPEPSS